MNACSGDLHDCLIFSFNILKWLKFIPYKEEMIYCQLKKLDQQLNFLKNYLKVKYEITDAVNVILWDDVLEYSQKSCLKYGDGVLLFWMESTDIEGHAIPIINGKLIWGRKYCAYSFVVNLARNFICKYIYRIT